MKAGSCALAAMLLVPTLATATDYQAVQCQGHYPHHLQGVCAQENAIYWSFTTQLVKTDLQGKVVKRVPVANHHGDLCYHEGKVYVAVNLGQFNQPAGKADSWVYVYNAETLEERARHEVQQVVHGAGGIACHDGRFILVGGLPEEIEENYLYEYDAEFAFQGRHVVPSGHTHLGIQTAAFHRNRWWFGCYGSDLLVTGPDFQLLAKHKFDCALGIEGLPDGRFFVAGGRCSQDAGCVGWVRLAVADDQHKLRILQSQTPQQGNQ